MSSSVAFRGSRVSASEGRGHYARMGFFKKGRRLHREGRRWAYTTRPIFARLNGPMTEALKKAEEVRVLVGLGDFSGGNIHLRVEPNRYLVSAKDNNTEFRGEIPLPKGVDLRRRVEHLENGILELVLPVKTRRGDGRQERKGNNARRPLHSGD
jgi:HSP20 family molecular chaperone IbpA